MTLNEVPLSEARASAKGAGLMFRAGRFSVRLLSPLHSVVSGVCQLYANAQRLDGDFADFTVRVAPEGGIRRVVRPQAVFFLNGAHPFSPLPLAHAFPLLEWGLNWCVSNHCHQYLIVHAAVLEKHGKALILPGVPGAGKSTLCALLASLGGWRLLSDELTLIDLRTGLIHPNPRPISLKNRSIDIVRECVPTAVLSPPVEDTLKGTVAHMKPPQGSIEGVDQPALPALVVFPRYERGAASHMLPLPRPEAFIRIADNAFNYSIIGLDAFHALCKVLDLCECYEYENGGSVDDALNLFEALVSP